MSDEVKVENYTGIGLIGLLFVLLFVFSCVGVEVRVKIVSVPTSTPVEAPK